MLKLYSPEKARRMIARENRWIETLSRRYPLPAACIKAILYKELIEMDILDPPADWAIETYWLRYALRRRLKARGIIRSAEPLLRRGFFGKRDSSTGYGQIFAYVAINAINFALSRGLADCESLGISAHHRLSPTDPDDLCAIWRRLHRNIHFNIEASALNLLAAAEEMTGRIDFPHYTDDELMLVFTRYNADVKHITGYGRDVYRHYMDYTTKGL